MTPRHIVGVACDYHDASATLVVDGDVVAAAAEERYSRLKHDPNFPHMALQACLDHAGLDRDAVDAAVFYEEPPRKLTRVLTTTLAAFPRGAGRFATSMRDWLTRRLWATGTLGRRLDLPPAQVHAIPHHVSHVAQAFLPSTFDEAAVLVVDAVGEWSSTSLARVSRHDPASLRVLESHEFPHSLGLFYSAFTGFCGFRPNDGECSTMALAAFGRPTRTDDVRKVLKLHDDGTYQLEPSLFDLTSPDLPYTSRFHAIFGAPRDPRSPLPFSALRDADDQRGVTPEAQGWADLAASVQAVLEQALLGLARRLHRLTSLDRLCLVGGVAFNCVAVRRLREEGPFREVYIPPDPGDGGASLGAAAWLAWQHGQTPRQRLHPYLGPDCPTEDVEALVAACRPSLWRGPEGRPVRVEAQRMPHEDALVERVVDYLSRGEVVGWYQGRFELGPRALGNRSLLVDPASTAVAGRMSRTIKHRADFRPYALSIAAEQADGVLDGPSSAHTARWMQDVSAVRQAALTAVRAGVHVDHTTRPNVCHADENPLYHRLLTAWAAAARPALLNTSLNERGYPIVRTPAEALLLFARTPLPTVVIGDVVLRKVE